jgi:hypothetical protein
MSIKLADIARQKQKHQLSYDEEADATGVTPSSYNGETGKENIQQNFNFRDVNKPKVRSRPHSASPSRTGRISSKSPSRSGNNVFSRLAQEGDRHAALRRSWTPPPTTV